ncbi:RecX family transcriptional regulator [Deinococcus arenicola]|uniref:Regulatory protein RecX n=1 Tax=Deinococcus arenicola TaxID=2994950 RepID=A0ABU4DN48_9DEIO|nr:RecX family transcriptional regulator [Deinococcus sp. ZS9-10]MDV6373855.1 RecX family transcriptional regulator [Deinococcus sp. ZS9-10]
MRSRRPRPPEGDQPAREVRPKTPEEQRDALLAYAFRALGGRALTETELRGKLERRSDNPELIGEVLKRVQELGYQADEQVARVEGNRRGVGGFRVRQTLKRRGVAEDLIQDTLEARDPDEERAGAIALLERRWPSLSRKRDPKASAYAFLARRGFGGDAIWPAIRELSERALEDEDGAAEVDGEVDAEEE